MKIIDFIKDDSITFWSSLLILFSTASLLFFLNIDKKSSFLILGFLLFVLILIFIIRFIIHKRRFDKLNSLIDSIEDKYLIGEIIPVPQGYVEKEYYKLMKEISKSAITNVEHFHKTQKEYEEYIENWVHEIKTPLMALTLMAENGADVSLLKSELKRVDNLLENILYYAKDNSYERIARLKSTKLEPIVNQAIEEEMSLLIMNGISIEVNNLNDFEVITDVVLFRFVLKQLLSNSAKYCPKCRVDITREGNKLIYEDNGIGIPKDVLPRITEKGFCYYNDRVYTKDISNNMASTGLGLYIANKICRSLHINMEVQSIEGKYTRFIFEFINKDVDNPSLQICKDSES